MEDREESRIGAAPLEVCAEVDAFEPLREQGRGEAFGPLIEIPKHELGAMHAPVVHDADQTLSLMTTFENCGAQMHVVKVQRVIANRDVGPLAAARLARPPREIVLHVLPHRQARQHDVTELMAAKLARGGHDPAHAKRSADFFGLRQSPGAGAHHFLQRDEIGINIGEHIDRTLRNGAAVQAAAAMNVVGRDTQGMTGHGRTIRLRAPDFRLQPLEACTARGLK